MVLPDIPTPPPRRDRRLGVPVVLGSLLVIGAVVTALMAMTSPEPVAEPDPTTTIPFVQPSTTVPFTPTGEPLDWELVVSLEGLRPIGVFDVGTTHIVFAVHINDHGLWVNRLGEGGHWEPLIQDARIHKVVRSELGWFAVGTDATKSRLIAWRSEDAVVWEPTELTVEVPEEWGTIGFTVADVHANDHLVVASTTVFPAIIDVYETVDPLIRDMYGPEVEWYPMYDDSGRNLVFAVYGPLLLHLANHTPEDLGIDGSQFHEENPGGEVRQSNIWVTTDGESWTTHPMPPTVDYLHGLFTDRDGLIWGAVQGSGVRLMVSSDGVNWHSPGTRLHNIWNVRPWPKGYVASNIGLGPESLMTSEDGLEWVPLSLDGYLTPPGQGSTYVSVTGSLDHGLAIYVRFGDFGGYIFEQESFEFERNGYTMTVGASGLQFSRDGEVVSVLQRGAGPSSDTRFDPDTRSVTFLDPNGVEMMTLTLAELKELEQLAYPRERRLTGEIIDVFLFTADGEEWIVQDFSEVAGIDASVSGFHFAGNSAYVVVHTDPEWNRASVYKAELPGRERN